MPTPYIVYFISINPFILVELNASPIVIHKYLPPILNFKLTTFLNLSDIVINILVYDFKKSMIPITHQCSLLLSNDLFHNHNGIYNFDMYI